MYYSMDLRTRVMEAVDKGMLRTEISRIFQVSIKTIYLWVRRRKETGNFAPITKFYQGHNHAIQDFEKFKQFVDQNGDRTQKHMAQVLQVSRSTICRAMKKIHYTRKKRLLDIKNEMKKKELYI